MHALICCFALVAGAAEPFDQWTAEKHGDAPLPDSVGARLSAADLKALENAGPTTPYTGLTCGIRLGDGTIWAGSPGGLLCLEAGAQETRKGDTPIFAARKSGQSPSRHWRLFHSRRWLPDDHVLQLAVARDGSVWVKTKAGTTRLANRRWTLDEKMDAIHRALRRHHVRDGFCCEIALKEPGSVAAGYVQPDSDNDGLWTAIYVAAEAFRYGATGDPQARANAWQSLQTLMLLEEITGIPGFAARSFVPIEIDKSRDRNWYRSADGKRWWKDDTSSDEVVGHFFAYFVYYLVAATDAEKERIRPVVGRIADHIIDHGYYYVGPTGRPTTWGVWAPEKLNRDVRRIPERCLNSLEVLSHLKVAEFITGNPRYRHAARELIDKHGYAANTVWQKIEWPPSEINHSDDELAFLSYYPLLWLERAADLRRLYLWSIERSWHYERPEQSPLWSLIYATALQAGECPDPAKRPASGLVDGRRYDLDACLGWFRLVPADTVSWTIANGKRRDLGTLGKNRFDKLDSRRVLPIDERLMLRWNADPYQLDGGDGGRTRGDGAFILLPYWLGRFHRLLD